MRGAFFISIKSKRNPNMDVTQILFAIVGLLIGGGLAYFLTVMSTRSKCAAMLTKAEQEAEVIKKISSWK